jgi:hypothetical protein
VVNTFGRLNIQHLGVNSIMCCDALAVTMHLVVLHVTEYSSYYVRDLEKKQKKVMDGTGRKFCQNISLGKQTFANFHLHLRI